MAVAGGPNLSENGLVFYYDTGNGKSYKGEPTINLFPDPTYTSTDGQVLSHTEYTRKPGQGYNGLDSVEGVVSSSYVSGQIARRWSINLPPGFYTHTFYVKKNCDFFRIEHLGTAVATSGGASQQQFKVDATTGATSDLGAGFTDYDVIDYGDWWKVWYVIEIVGSGNAIFDYEPLRAVGNRFEFCGSQIEAKTHPTPFTAGTRSATESLYDFIGDSALDVSNVSFDSNADITFDGTDDYIRNTTITLPSGNSPRTLEAVVKSHRASNVGNADHIVNYGSGTTGGAFGFMIHQGNKFRFYGHGGSFDFDSNILADTNWHYHCITYDGTTVKYYLDGVEVASQARTLSTTSSNLAIGHRPDLATGNNANVDVPITKVYNRSLTAEEVENNFNGLRNRFGI